MNTYIKILIYSIIGILCLIFLYNYVFKSNEEIPVKTDNWPMLYGNSSNYINLGTDRQFSSIDYLSMPKNFLYDIFPLISYGENYNIVSDKMSMYIQGMYSIKRISQQRKRVWTYKAHPGYIFLTNKGSLILVNKKVIAVQYSPQTAKGLITAINSDTGQEDWTIPLEDWKDSPEIPNITLMISENETVFIGVNCGQGRNNFYAIMVDKGKVLFKKQLPGVFLRNSSPAVSSGKIYPILKVKENYSQLYIIDQATGKVIDSVYLEGNFPNQGIIKDDKLFVVSDTVQQPKPYSTVFVIDLKKNAIQWQLTVPPTFSYSMKDNVLILAGADFNKISAFDLKKRCIKWSIDEKNDNSLGMFESIVIGKTIVATRSDGYIYLINLFNGEILRKEKIQTPWQKILDFSPAILNSIPGKNSVIVFLDTGDAIYIH